jgi:hypothetical protein
MHIHDVHHAIDAGDQSHIRAAFRALVNYPGEDAIDGATARQLVSVLGRVCVALEGDEAVMPRNTMQAVQDAADGALRGGTYAEGASAVLQCARWWNAHLLARAS